MDGVPARYLPSELKAPTRSGKKTIDLALLKQTPPSQYLVDAGDVLGIYVEGVLGKREDVPPVHFPLNDEVPPSMGYPLPVREDGTISIPLIRPINVRGMTIRQVEETIRYEYTQNRQILQPGRDRIYVSLQKPRSYRVTVIRQEGGEAGNALSAGQFNLGAIKRGTGKVVKLPAYKNDVLHALAETGGLPGLDAENTIYVVRSGLHRQPPAPAYRPQPRQQQVPQIAPRPTPQPVPAPQPNMAPQPGAAPQRPIQSPQQGQQQFPSAPQNVQPPAPQSSAPGTHIQYGRPRTGYSPATGIQQTAGVVDSRNYWMPATAQTYHPTSPLPTSPTGASWGYTQTAQSTAAIHPQMPGSPVAPGMTQQYGPVASPSGMAPSGNFPPGQQLPWGGWPPNGCSTCSPHGSPLAGAPRGFGPSYGNDQTVQNPGVVKIPVRLSSGQTVTFTERDIVLQDGDVVFIESRDTEIFYTGGLLGGGQFTLPRDYDLDLLGAIAIAQSQNGSQGGGSRRGIGGPSALNQDVTISASEAVIIRRLPGGTQVPIKVDLYEARLHLEENILIQPGDMIYLQYTPMEAIGAFFERHILESAVFGLAAAQVNQK